MASAFPGADVGAKVNAADQSLGNDVGEIRLSGGGAIVTQVVIGSRHTLRVMGNGTYTSNLNSAVILLKDNAQLKCDSWDPILQESTGVRGITDPWSVVLAYNGGTLASPNGALSQNLNVTGCHFRGANRSFSSVAGAVSVGNCHNCQVTDNWLEGTRSIGILVGGGSSKGFYAQNVLVSHNLLTNVASQNLAVVNSMDVVVSDNRMNNPGQLGGPGVSVIDVEPNVGDVIKNIDIRGNSIDASGQYTTVTNGIVIQNGNGAVPFAAVQVRNNSVIGAKPTQAVYNNISYAGILVRSASDVRIESNNVQRVSRGILLDYGANRVLVKGNVLASTGSGSTQAIVLENASNNQVMENYLFNIPGDALRLPTSIVTSIREAGTSRNNLISGNIFRPPTGGWVIKKTLLSLP
jgi:hypothetical protein